MSKNDGGPAFPIVGEYGMKLNNAEGMTLRDYFAAAALQGILCNGWMPARYDQLRVESAAFAIADQMLSERDK